MNENKYTPEQQGMISILQGLRRTGPMSQGERNAWNRLFDEVEARRAALNAAAVQPKESLAERFNAWLKKVMEEVAAEGAFLQEPVAVAAASKNEKNESARRSNFRNTFHLKGKEEEIEADLDRIEGTTLEMFIKSNIEENLESVGLLREDGTYIELGKIEENTYAVINLAELKDKLVIVTENGRKINFKD